MNANYIVGERYGDVDSYAFIADFATKAQANWMIWEGMSVGTINRNVTSFATMNSDTTEIRGIKFEPTGGVTIQADSEFCLYQYKES